VDVVLPGTDPPDDDEKEWLEDWHPDGENFPGSFVRARQREHYRGRGERCGNVDDPKSAKVKWENLWNGEREVQGPKEMKEHTKEA
jgi:hypothetical protein